MANTPNSPDFNSNTHGSPDHGTPPKTPRWVKMFGFIALALVLLFVILHLTGHGMGNHTMMMEHGAQKP